MMIQAMNFSWDMFAVFFLTSIAAYVNYKIFQLYNMRRQLPPGPFPWPVIGNFPSFNQPNTMPHEAMNNLSKIYGPVYTLFMGHMPCVVVTDPLMAQQVLRKTAFAGRPMFQKTNDIMHKPGHIDVVLADFSNEWIVLKKVAQTAIHKYALSMRSATNVIQAVDRVMDHVGEGVIDADHTISLLMNMNLAEAAFGQRYKFDDPDFLSWCKWQDLAVEGSNVLNVIAFAPILRFVLWRRWSRFLSGWNGMMDYIAKMYKQSLQNPVEIADESFCHAFINAKMEAEEAESKILTALNERNMHNAIVDLFVAGTETSKNTIKWMIILMCKYPEIQQRMREEVRKVIGDSDPDPVHRQDCHMVQAFIHEAIRFKANLQTALPHKSLSDEVISGHKIPKGTTLLISLGTSMNDENVWGDPQVFRPERFLNDDGVFQLKNSEHFIPFSAGRRSCPGEKLAMSNFFLITARLVQKTKYILIPGGVTDHLMRGDTDVTVTFNPMPFSMKLFKG